MTDNPLDHYTTDHDFYEVFYSRPEEWPDGETALLDAILRDAMKIIREGPKDRKRFMDALNWVNDRSADGMFTFANICSILKIDSAAARAAINRAEKVAPPREPKPKPNRYPVYCRCCRKPGTYREVCKEVYAAATNMARGRPSDAQLMRVLERKRIRWAKN